jgi:starch phosphorylase
MMRDYVNGLYVPSAGSSRALNDDFAGAQELAAWKHRVTKAWHGVAIDHVDSAGVGDTPEIGQTLSVDVFVSLGELEPGDVDVQVVHGRIRRDDELVDTQVASLTLAETYEGGRYRFQGSTQLAKSGAFGYTTRIVPRHRLLATPAELGYVVLPPA